MPRPLTWTYGITTVPARIKDLLPRTIASLKKAGFDKPRLFVDGPKFLDQYIHFNLPLTYRTPEPVKTSGNWFLGMWELYIRNPHCERYAMFQDDIVCVKNLRKYLDRLPYPHKGYINLLTFPKYQEHAEKEGVKHGLFRTLQKGLSATGLVFSREALLVMLGSKEMRDKPMTAGRLAFSNLDGVLQNAMRREANFEEYCHIPSLIQHTGQLASTMGGRRHPLAPSFPGEDFDAMDLLSQIQDTPQVPNSSQRVKNEVKTNKTPSPDVLAALAILSLDSEPVERWLMKNCKCKDRANRLNQLDMWAKRVLSGKTTDMEKYLEEIITCGEDDG